MGRGRRASEVILTPVVPTSTSSALSSILPFSNECFGSSTHNHIPWYDWWVQKQVQAQPKELFSTISAKDKESDARWTESFGRLWQENARYLTTNKSGSIDEVLAHLLEIGCIQLSNDPSSRLTAKSLVFALIGWQTMLYQPDIHSCPFSQLAIESQMGLHQGQCHMSLKQPQSACKKPMHEFLLGYGMLLPPGQFCAPESAEEKAAFDEWTSVGPESFNTHLLMLFGGVQIEWVDSLPCHLEFDGDSNTLFLFRYPSFCLANLESVDGSVNIHKSVLHGCVACSKSSSQWAKEEEIPQMLQEIILSFRLLFGQNRASRKLFSTLEPFLNIPTQGTDPFLMTVCTQRRYRASLGFHERDTYDLRRDFPILRSRLAILISHLSSKKARTWREHWLDKRDSASWLTFWAVIIIGGTGILLAFLQVILQIVQIVKT